MVDLVGVKCIYLAVMFVVTVVCGVLPVKLLQLLRSRTNSMETFTNILSILSCFAGGVFLGVCLLDMLLDAFETYEEFKTAASFESDVHLIPLIIGAGFFFIYLLDGAMSSCCGHSHSHDVTTVIHVSPSTPGPSSSSIEGSEKRTAYISSSADSLMPSAKEERGGYLKSLTFILAFLLHVTLEGFALGVQKDEVASVSLFVGIILHKGIAALSIGTRLHLNHPRNTIFVVAMLVFVATVCTIGGVIGMLLKDASMDSAAKAMVETVLTSISIGTFLYITFFEILAAEKGTLVQRLAALVGFIVIGIPAIFLPSV